MLRAKEKTSSSVSTLHFGHYMAGAKSDKISYVHSFKTSISLKHGTPLGRWVNGLFVMLEKELGCNLISKLRAVLRMEADFKFSNDILYDVRMMDTVRKFGLMSEDIYSEKIEWQMMEHRAKVLCFGVVRQFKLPAGLSLVEATNYYGSVAHAIAALAFRAFGVPKDVDQVMLQAIEEVKYFLRTAFGDSKKFRGSKIRLQFQGLCQENGAAPAGWAVISIVVLGAHKREAVFSCLKANLPSVDLTSSWNSITRDRENFKNACPLFCTCQFKKEKSIFRLSSSVFCFEHRCAIEPKGVLSQPTQNRMLSCLRLPTLLLLCSL